MYLHIRNIENKVKEKLEKYGYNEKDYATLIGKINRKEKNIKNISLSILMFLYICGVSSILLLLQMEFTVSIAIIMSKTALFLFAVNYGKKRLTKHFELKKKKLDRIRIEYGDIKDDIDAIKPSFTFNIVRYEYTIHELCEIVNYYKENYHKFKGDGD